MSLASDPGPDGRGRLSVDMRNRVQNMVRPPLPSPPSPPPLPIPPPPPRTPPSPAWRAAADFEEAVAAQVC